jgi:hypothetical protein
VTDAPGAAPRQEREALAEIIRRHIEAAFASAIPEPWEVAEKRAGWCAEDILAAGYVTPEAHAAVVAERDNLSLSFCNAVTRCEGAEATLSERTFERDNAARTAQEFAQAVVDANAAHVAAMREAWEAGRDAAVALLRKIGKDTDEVNEEYTRKRLPGVCVEPDCEDLAELVSRLTPPAPKGGAE